MIASDEITYNNKIGYLSRLVLVAAAVVSFSLYYPFREFHGLVEQSGNVTVANDNTAFYTQISATVDDDEFQREWSKAKNKLCPSGLPSHKKFGPILFDLARDEMGLRKLHYSSITKFFTFMPDRGSVYIMNSTDSSASGSFLHMPIWKCANNDVRKNLRISLDVMDVSLDCRRGKFECWVDAIGGMMNVTRACIVAVVRDPITHFLSGYNEYEIRLNTDDTVNLTLKKRSAPNPLNFERFVFGDEKRFEQFIVDILTSPGDVLEDNLSHMYSMTGILSGLYKAYKRNLDAYLPSIDDLENTYPSFLKETCPHVLPESAFEPWDKEERHHHVSEADALGFRSAANAVWARGGRASRALCVIHAMDYACYDKVPVDDFCKGVYMSEAFTQAIS
mmetsp:Transcript_3169/g.6900  ORF Transcript_3169/g.6900 Transcript_3169/m.6900 type:complete len:392 (+) Transcript_3169:184-1359(+)